MQVLPAIDIQDGRLLRLAERVPRERWDALPDPVTQAATFLSQGATWLHVVDMDRAFSTGKRNTAVIRRICALPGARVQLGGNVDGEEWVREAVDTGATRVVLGTAAAQSSRFERLLVLLGHTVEPAVNIDVRQGTIAHRVEDAGEPMAIEALVRRARGHGIHTVVYRDLDRDGRAEGADLEGAARVATMGVSVIAAGGVARLDELAVARGLGLDGVIVGRALYDGRFTLEEATACLP